MVFRNGNIISLRMMNFQTFKDTTIKFSPTLNFILGPNGSGKSTISNAISFIFCGTPKTIGKSKNIKEYIRFGEEECLVEAIVLYKNKKTRLARVIKNNSNFWYLDSKCIKKNEYDLIISDLKVNINNLCQYLPQEKVSEFVRLSPEELLIQTLSSLGKKDINDEISYIRKIEGQLQETESREKLLSKEQSNIQNIVESINKNLEKMKERDEKMEKIKMMEAKRIWIEYENVKKEYSRLNRSCKMLQSSFGENNKELEEIMKKIKEINESPLNVKLINQIKVLKAWDGQLMNCNERLKNQFKEYNLLDVDIEHINKKKERRKLSIDTLRKDIDNIGIEILRLKTVLKEKLFESEYLNINYFSNENSAENKRIKITEVTLSNEFKDFILEEIVKIDNIDAPFKEYGSTIINELEDELYALKRHRNDIQDNCSDIKHRFDALEEKKRKINEAGERRLEFLKRYHRDTYNAVIWLRENKGIFKDEIIEPAFLNIDILNKEFINEIETFLSFQLLLSFICKNSDDFEMFMKIIKDEKKYSINALESIKNMVESQNNKEELLELGFDGVVMDFIATRKEIRDFFVVHGHLDEIPITKKNFDERKIFETTKIKRMAMNNKYFEIKRSRYDKNDFVILSNTIKTKNIFSSKLDTSDIEIKLLEYDSLRKKHAEELKEIYQKIETLDNKLKKLYSIKNEYEANIGDLKTKINLMRITTNSLEGKKQQLNKIERNDDLEKELLMINEQKLKMVSVIDNLKLEIVGILKDEKYLTEYKLCLGIYNEIKSEYKKLEQLNNSKFQLEKQNKETEKMIEETLSRIEKTKMQLSHDKELLLSNSYDPIDMVKLPNTIDELNVEIAKEKTQIKFIQVDEGIKKEYNSNKETLDKLSQTLSEVSSNKIKYQEDINRKRKEIVNEINSIVKKINLEFKNIFIKIGGEGKVSFDYLNLPCKSWKLNIFVKFRINEGLEILNSYRQSGGEKSVSTILYLLALQQNDDVPFRLVDEINQGMDEINERNVLNMLFNICNSDLTTQFFIISPKLVENLEYIKNMKIIVLFSDQSSKMKKLC